MIAMFPKGLVSVRGDFFREQTVECVLSNEASVQLSRSLFAALLVRSRHWEHMCFSPLSFSSSSHSLSLSLHHFSLLYFLFHFFSSLPAGVLHSHFVTYSKCSCDLLSDLAHNPVTTTATRASSSKCGKHHSVWTTLLTLRWFILFCFQPMASRAWGTIVKGYTKQKSRFQNRAMCEVASLYFLWTNNKHADILDKYTLLNEKKEYGWHDKRP